MLETPRESFVGHVSIRVHILTRVMGATDFFLVNTDLFQSSHGVCQRNKVEITGIGLCCSVAIEQQLSSLKTFLYKQNVWFA